MVIALIVVGGVILAHFLQISEWITAPTPESRYVKYSHYQVPDPPKTTPLDQAWKNVYVSPNWVGGLGAGITIENLYRQVGMENSATAMQAQMNYQQQRVQYEYLSRMMQNRTVEKACTDEPTGVTKPDLSS